MKDFTAAEYIRPIVEEIKERYTPDYTPAALEMLNCIVVLKRIRSRDALAIRTPDKGGFYYSGPAARKVYKALADYAAAAETEPGELDRWTWEEHKRIQEAIRAALIQEYRNPWKHTDTRAAALKILYSLPGYAEAKLDTKNYIYDALSSKLKALQNA